MDDRKRVFGTSDPINPACTEGRWQDALRRVRSRIAAGELLVRDPGSATDRPATSWGMCTADPGIWPDPDDHVFPADFERSRRVAPRDPPEGARCPMDLGEDDRGTPAHWGCFHRCFLFQGTDHEDGRLRLPVLNFYDEEIAKRQAEHGRCTASSDPDPWTRARTRSRDLEPVEISDHAAE